MENQTAVEFFYENIRSHFKHDGDLLEDLIFTMAIAKLKERQQIVDAYTKDNTSYFPKEERVKLAENYYKETFKSE